MPASAVAFPRCIGKSRAMPDTELSLFDLDARQSAGAELAASNTVPVLLPLALSEPYTYTVPDGEELAPGTFVVVPLGPMKRVGVVWRASEGGQKPFDPRKLKAVIAALDVPPLPPVNLAFADWVANYTLAPKGMVLQMMMSARLVFEAEEPRWGFRVGGVAPATSHPGARTCAGGACRWRGLVQKKADGRRPRECRRYRWPGGGRGLDPRGASPRPPSRSETGFR